MYKKVYQFILGQGGFEQGCCCCSLKWQLYRAASSVVRSQALDLVCVPSPQDTEQLPQLDHGVTTLPPTISNNHDLRYMTWWESESCSRHVRRPMLGLARTLLHSSVNRSMAWMIDQDWVSDWSSDWLSDWLRNEMSYLDTQCRSGFQSHPQDRVFLHALGPDLCTFSF